MKIGSLGTLMLLPVLSAGCMVPQNRYDAAVHRHDEERARRGTAESDLLRARAELARLEVSLGQKEQSLTAQEGELAQSKLEAAQASTEREDAARMVEQLRGELARVGDHLREFSDRKRELETALGEAEAKAKRLDAAEREMARKVLVMRDVSLAFGDAANSGRVVLTAVEGKPLLRLDAGALFGKGEGDPKGPDAALVERLAQVVREKEGTSIEIADRTLGGTPEDRVVRLQQVTDLLSGQGLGLERIGLSLPPERDGAAGKVEPASAAPPSWREGPGSIELVVEISG